MNHKRYVLLKVKEGKLDQWKQWCNLLMTSRKQEAIDSFKYEGVSSEECHLFKVCNDYYLLGVAEFDGEHKEANMDLEINKEHKKQKKECLEALIEGEELFVLKK